MFLSFFGKLSDKPFWQFGLPNTHFRYSNCRLTEESIALNFIRIEWGRVESRRSMYHASALLSHRICTISCFFASLAGVFIVQKSCRHGESIHTIMVFPPDFPSLWRIRLQAMCCGVAVIDCCCFSFAAECPWRADCSAVDVNLGTPPAWFLQDNALESLHVPYHVVFCKGGVGKSGGIFGVNFLEFGEDLSEPVGNAFFEVSIDAI